MLLEKDGADIRTNSIYGRVMVGIVLLTIAYVMVLLDNQTFKEGLIQEIHVLESTTGKDDTGMIVGRAKSWYYHTATRTGIAAFIDNMSAETGYKGDGYWRVPAARIGENIKMIWYQACLRLSVALYWFFLLVPLIGASFIDGWYHRRIKQHEFSVASTGVFRLAVWVSILFILASQFYLFVPHAGAIGPLFPLIVALSIAFLGRQMIANAAKVM